MFDAVERHGDSRASAAPLPGGGFATVRGLPACAGRGRLTNLAPRRLVRGVWRHADAAALVAAFRGGTARMAAMLEAQAESAMPAILAGLESGAASWRDKDGANPRGANRMCDSGRDQTLTPEDRGLERGPRPERPSGRRISFAFVVSALLHAALLVPLLIRLTWHHEPELLPPPATVNMVFEGGRPEQPSAPEPRPVPVPSAAQPSEIGGLPGTAPQAAPASQPAQSSPSEQPGPTCRHRYCPRSWPWRRHRCRFRHRPSHRHPHRQSRHLRFRRRHPPSMDPPRWSSRRRHRPCRPLRPRNRRRLNRRRRSRRRAAARAKTRDVATAASAQHRGATTIGPSGADGLFLTAAGGPQCADAGKAVFVAGIAATWP